MWLVVLVGAPLLGGTETHVGDHPAVVAVEVKGALCTGVLIDPEWVVTAAHCISPATNGGGTQDQITPLTHVHINTVDLPLDPGTVIDASETIPGIPNWGTGDIGHDDIGLIHLATPVTDIARVPVNFAARKAPIGVDVTMIGFGRNATNGGSGVQRVLGHRSSVDCPALLGNTVSNANLLCFSQSDGKGQCEGDSGGPSVITLGGVDTLVGLASFGDSNCAVFGAHTRIDIEQDFLRMHVPALGTCTTATDCGGDQTCFGGNCITEPFQNGGAGATCATPADCDNQQCANGPGGMKCTLACTPADPATCPDGFDCLDAGLCWPHQGGGCCDAGNGGPTALFALGAIVLFAARTRGARRGCRARAARRAPSRAA
jgi:hypothetical protein